MTTATITAESPWRRSVSALVCLAALVLGATACESPGSSSGEGTNQSGGSGRNGSNQGGNDNGAGGAPGVPGRDGNGSEAVGAPIKIPSIQEDQGRPLAEVKAEIEESVIEQCGGEMCITLIVEESNPDFLTCRFVHTRPTQGTEVERGSTVVIVAGMLPCGDEPTPDGDEPTPEDGLPTDGGEVPETNEPGTS